MRHARRKALREADCVLLAGVPCDFRLDYGRHIRRSATLIAANRSRHDATLNRRPSIVATGDAGLFIEQLAERLGGSARPSAWIDELRARDEAREREIDQQAGVSGERVNPIAFLRALEAAAADEAVFVADGGDFVATASYIVRPRSPLSWLDPGVFGTLGVGAGFAIGAALTRPRAEVWLLWGDGASGYGLAEFDTLVRHRIPVIAVVGNDASWAQIAREQVKMLGDDVGTVLAHTAYEEVARGFGAEGIAIRRQTEIDAALACAKTHARAGRSVLVNVWLDRGEFRKGSVSM
jgi:acetolactate synthase-1/2/3 large subunit